MKDYEGKRVLVFGLARSGAAAVNLLAGAGASVCAADENASLSPPSGLAGADVRLGPFDRGTLAGVDEVVLSPGVPSSHPVAVSARKMGIPVISELELAFRFLEAPVIAVTGTNGKSTTVSMIGSILREDGRQTVVAGNVGVPLSSVAGSLGGGGIYVVEVSSFQLETVDRFHPVSAGMLNLTPDHLDRYGSAGEYYEAKMRIMDNLEEEDLFFYNSDDPRCRGAADRTRARTLPFSSSGRVERGIYLEGAHLIRERDDGTEEIIAERDEIGTPGLHNIENALAAVAAVSPFGVSAGSCRRALTSFKGLPHRMEEVGSARGVTFYNDSKATNVEAALKSLSGLGSPVVLIAGGVGKGQDFSPLAGAAGVVRRAFTMGEAAAEIESAIGDAIPCERAGTMCEAVEKAAGAAEPGWLVVLSPACASFDMFDDFEDRGEVFRDCVGSLTGR